MPVTHGVPTITINHDHQFMVCDPNATMVPTGAVGFFARDTRFVSGYSVTINGRVPLLLDASTIDHFSARHEFTSPELPL
ncbi:MAG TPA: glycogen debranching N-terminal domain-containing protein, partial [Acidimicrobiales bacterium]